MDLEGIILNKSVNKDRCGMALLIYDTQRKQRDKLNKTKMKIQVANTIVE